MRLQNRLRRFGWSVMVGAVLFLLAGTVLTACAGSGKTTKPSDEKTDETEKVEELTWNDYVVRVQTVREPFTVSKEPTEIEDEEVKKHLSADGSGHVIKPDRLVTNYHVVHRASEIEAKTDEGEAVEIEGIVAMDADRDLALLAIEPMDRPAFETLERPENPDDLRRTGIIAVGNTAGKGLSVYEGIINNLMETEFGETIVHDANIAEGASGGPLFDREITKLYGLNNAISRRFNQSWAIPGWTISKFVGDASDSEPKELRNMWSVDDSVDLENVSRHELCLSAQSATEFVTPARQLKDLGVRVEVQDSDSTFQYDVRYHGRERSGVIGTSPEIEDSGTYVFTTYMPGYYAIRIANTSESGSGDACAKVSVGAVSW